MPRLSVRNVSAELLGEIDRRLVIANQDQKKKMTRSQYLNQILSDVFLDDKSTLLVKTNEQVEELLSTVNAHLASEKLLIRLLQDTKEKERQGK